MLTGIDGTIGTTSATLRIGQKVRVLPYSYPMDIECGAKREDLKGWVGFVVETDADPLSCYCWVNVDGERWHVSHDRIVP